MPDIYLICGFLGAGKSTFSKQLAADKNAIYLNADDLVMQMFSPAEYEHNWEQSFTAALEKIWDIASDASPIFQNIV